MNKLLRLLVVTLCVMGCLFTAGCGEEEAYNKAKNEYVAMFKDWKQKADDLMLSDKSVPIPEQEKFLKETSAEMQKKLDEMKKIAAKDTNLNNDYLKVQKEFDERIKIRYEMIREAKAIEKMRQESSTSKQGLIDPIGDYYKKKGIPLGPK